MISWTDIKMIKRTNLKRKRINKFKIFVSMCLALVICLTLNYKRLELQKQQYACDKTLEGIERDMADEEKRTEDIAERKAYVQTKKYAEEVARERLGLVYKDEIIFKANEDE